MAFWFVTAVVLLAILTFVGWMFWGPQPGLAQAIANSVAVLIIACPFALGLATPMSIMVGVGKGAQRGVLVRHAAALESAKKIIHLITDNTGTLTEGRPMAKEIASIEPGRENHVLRLAYSLEQLSEHPFAQSSSSLESALAGSRWYCHSSGAWRCRADAPAEGPHRHLDRREQDPRRLHCRDRSGQSLNRRSGGALHALGIWLVMLAGDNRQTAEPVGMELGIDEIRAKLNPADKQQIVQQLRAGVSWWRWRATASMMRPLWP